MPRRLRILRTDDVVLLKGAADADVEVLVPPAVLGTTVSATVEGSGVLIFTALAVLDVDKTSCSIQLGQKCWWAQVLTLS